MDKAPLFSEKDIIPVSAICIVGLMAFASAGGQTSSAPPADPPDWHVGHINGGCFAYSPAEFLAQYKGDPDKPRVRETRDDDGTLAVVEVTSWTGFYSSTRTFYRTKAACEAAIAEAEHIPDDYR